MTPKMLARMLAKGLAKDDQETATQLFEAAAHNLRMEAEETTTCGHMKAENELAAEHFESVEVYLEYFSE